jgi:hypothetical protein
VSPARRADLALALVCVALLASALAVRPVWRAADLRTRDLVDTHEAYDRGDATDPWGRAWSRTTFAGMGFIAIHSHGRDGIGWNVDDVRVATISLDAGASRAPRPERSAELRAHDGAPRFLLAVLAALLAARVLSTLAPRGPRLPHRFAGAMAIGGLPALIAFAALTRFELLDALAPGARLLVPPEVAALGSLWALFAALTFAHRELGDAPPVRG